MLRIRHVLPLLILSACVTARTSVLAESGTHIERYLLLNLHSHEIESESFRTIKQLDPSTAQGTPRLGVATIISYLREPQAQNIALLRRLLELCRRHRLAVVVQLDGEQWWNDRPDLWNWWDEARPGFDPANAANVEWSGWGAEHALKISWRNWGQQHRVLPPPNLMSHRYRAACHAEMRPLLEAVVRWRASLTEEEQWLFVGVKVGWESAVGMGNYYFPDGNSLLDHDPANDPTHRVQPEILPGRGLQPIGYAAVSTAGLAEDGELQEEHLAEVIRRHLEDLSAGVRKSGLPREQVFTHCGGWAKNELLYSAALNEHSCPGWSFYRHGRDPRGDRTAMAAMAASDSRYWAAAEWLPIGARNADDWQAALTATLSIDRCRYLCVYNWRGVKDNVDVLEGIRGALRSPLKPR